MLHNANAKEGAEGKKNPSEHNSALSLIFRQLPFLVVNSFNNLYHFQKTFLVQLNKSSFLICNY